MSDYTQLIQWGAHVNSVTRHSFNLALEDRYTFEFSVDNETDAAGHSVSFYMLFSPDVDPGSALLQHSSRIWVDVEFNNGTCKVWEDGTSPNDPTAAHGASPRLTVVGVPDGGATRMVYLVDVITENITGGLRDQEGQDITQELADEVDTEQGPPPLYIFTSDIYDSVNSILKGHHASIGLRVSDAGAVQGGGGGTPQDATFGALSSFVNNSLPSTPYGVTVNFNPSVPAGTAYHFVCVETSDVQDWNPTGGTNSVVFMFATAGAYTFTMVATVGGVDSAPLTSGSVSTGPITVAEAGTGAGSWIDGYYQFVDFDFFSFPSGSVYKTQFMGQANPVVGSQDIKNIDFLGNAPGAGGLTLSVYDTLDNLIAETFIGYTIPVLSDPATAQFGCPRITGVTVNSGIVTVDWVASATDPVGTTYRLELGSDDPSWVPTQTTGVAANQQCSITVPTNTSYKYRVFMVAAIAVGDTTYFRPSAVSRLCQFWYGAVPATPTYWVIGESGSSPGPTYTMFVGFNDVSNPAADMYHVQCIETGTTLNAYAGAGNLVFMGLPAGTYTFDLWCELDGVSSTKARSNPATLPYVASVIPALAPEVMTMTLDVAYVSGDAIPDPVALAAVNGLTFTSGLTDVVMDGTNSADYAKVMSFFYQSVAADVVNKNLNVDSNLPLPDHTGNLNTGGYEWYSGNTTMSLSIGSKLRRVLEAYGPCEKASPWARYGILATRDGLVSPQLQVVNAILDNPSLWKISTASTWATDCTSYQLVVTYSINSDIQNALTGTGAAEGDLIDSFWEGTLSLTTM